MDFPVGRKRIATKPTAPTGSRPAKTHLCVCASLGSAFFSVRTSHLQTLSVPAVGHGQLLLWTISIVSLASVPLPLPLRKYSFGALPLGSLAVQSFTNFICRELEKLVRRFSGAIWTEHPDVVHLLGSLSVELMSEICDSGGLERWLPANSASLAVRHGEIVLIVNETKR